MYIWGYIVIILAASILMTVKSSLAPLKIEHFQSNVETNEVELETKPMEVYFTDDIERCDFPSSKYFTTDSTIANTEVDYSFDVKWYKRMFRYLKTIYDDMLPYWKEPNSCNVDEKCKERAATLLQLRSIIDNYERFPGDHRTKCKVKVPGWVTFMPKRTDIKTSEKILLGDITNNATRGPPNSWAFIGNTRPNIYYLTANGIEFALDKNKDDYYKITVDGTTYTRGAIQEFSKNMINAIYCDAITDDYNDYVIYLGLQIDPETNIVNFIKNNKVVEIQDITDYDIVKFFVPFFQLEDVVDGGKVEYIERSAITKAYKVTRIVKSLCGVLKKKITDVDITVTFEGKSEIKSILTNLAESKYYSGGTETIAKTKIDLTAKLDQLTKDIDSAIKSYYNKLQLESDARNILQGDIDTINNKTREIEVLKRLKTRWWFSTWSSDTQNSINKKLEARNTEYGKINNSISQSLTQYNTAKANTSAALTLWNQKVEEYNNTKKIRDNVDDYGRYMHAELIKDIRNMLVNQKMHVDTSTQPVYVSKKDSNKRVELPGLYWRHLSYDGNLYVVL